ncbi:MAG: TetR/AcrR family transcriptional regulator [Firmicutes bacterium]|nr:TetR/AcrR family transcriptional regulator [Bacillota bacterium]
MKTRNAQKEKRRREILYAALDLFVRKGVSDTKISDIAEKVGMSIGLLFNYFESKEALYYALLQIGLEAAKSVSEFPYEKPLAFFTASAEYIFSATVQEPVVARIFVLMKQAQYSENVPEAIRAQITHNSGIAKAAEIIKQGQADGSVKSGDPLALALAFWLSIQSTAEAFVLMPDMPFPKAEWFVDILKNHKECSI